MDFATAKNAIDLLMESPGKEKLIKIYGGEPLLYFDLIKKIAAYSLRCAVKNGKKITLTPCTNAILLSREHLNFFKENNMKLAISLDGDRVSHDRFRGYGSIKATYDTVIKKTYLAMKTLGKRNAAVNFGVTPFSVKRLFDNFVNLTTGGSIDTVNIEIIQHFQPWRPISRKLFALNLRKIIQYILSSIKNNKFLFLTTINREIKYSELSRFFNGQCHFFDSLEVYPFGVMAFSSFLLNTEERKKYLVGNIKSGYIKKRYRDCTFSNSKRCQECHRDYYQGYKIDENANRLVELRNKISIDAARYIFDRAKQDNLFRKYILEAKKHICF